MLIIGIDPGISGSICFFENGKVMDIIEMPNMAEGKKSKRQVNGAQIYNEILSRIKNYNKPMLSIASYTLPILHEMANILHINLYNDSGKKKLKKDIYQDVSEKII